MAYEKRNVWLALVISISYGAACAQIVGIEDLPPAVDVVIALDTSASMSKAVEAVETVLHQDFAAVLDEAGVDYRIIMLADFPPRDGRASDGQVDPGDPTLCIGPPLAPQDCANLPADQRKPDNGDPETSKFFHYDVHIDSFDVLFMTVGELDDPWGDTGTVSTAALYPSGWGQLLREGTAKIFIAITDDESMTMTSEEFDRQIRAKLASRFPADPAQRYVFHSIIAANRRDGLAWQPHEPVQDEKCEANMYRSGWHYQTLSKNTGGLRFSLCNVLDEDPGNDDFDVIFRAIAADVASTAASRI